MSREIARAGGENVDLATFPGAGHGLSYLADPAKYEKSVRAFVHRLGLSE